MVTRRQFVKGALGVGAGMACGCAATPRGSADGDPRPNVVVILADDLGFECLGAYGGQSYKTPNLDRLAQSGMRFNYHFGTPVCSPARAQMLTGRYSFRSGFIDISGRSGAIEALDPKKEATLANLMKHAGYATAITGKWHLGWGNKPTTGPAEYDPKQYRASTNIRACGFDEQYCFSTSHISYGPPVTGQYHPDLYQAWALKYLERRKGRRQPFFMYYGLGLPHFDFDPTPLNPQGKKNDRANFPYMVEYLDRQIGELVDKLEQTALRQNTLILFSSDNACDGHKSRLNGREVVGGKSGLKDTGTWVPLLASWPKAVKEGSVCDDLTDFTDFLPTLCELGRASAPDDRAIDGHSFAPQLRGQRGNARQFVYVQLVNKWFVREKKYKLRETGRLYDLAGTPFEEKRIERKDDTAESRAARERLAGLLAGLLAGDGASKRPAAAARSEGKSTVEKVDLKVALPLVNANGRPLLAEVVLKNAGKQPVKWGADLRVKLYDAVGQELPPKAQSPKREEIPVEPGKQANAAVDLSTTYAIAKPGTYSITVECDVEGEELKGKKKMLVEHVAFVVSVS